MILCSASTCHGSMVSKTSDVFNDLYLELLQRPKRSYLKMGKCRKKYFRYRGPFEILRRMGEQSYKLTLPPHLHVLDVFHVCLLKKCVPNPGHILDLDDNVVVNQEEF